MKTVVSLMLAVCFLAISCQKDQIAYRPVPISDAAFWIPESFSPNGDGINDFFTFSLKDTLAEVAEFSLCIFGTGKGKAVYFAKDADFLWDGRHKGEILPAGSYPFLLRYRLAGEDGRELQSSVQIIY